MANEEGDLTEAEKWYIEAGDPGSAVEMYKQNNMPEDAERVAREYIPEIMSNSHNKMTSSNAISAHHTNNNSTTGNAGTFSTELQQIIAKANYFRENGEYEEAVNTLLKTSQKNTHNIEELISVWDEAITICSERMLPNLNKVISTVASNLDELGKYETAANYWLEINNNESAINSYLNAKQFIKAKQLAEAVLPEYISMIENKYQSHLIENDNLDQIDASAAKSLYQSKQDWEKLYQLAQGNETEIANAAARHAKSLVNDGKIIQAIDVLTEFCCVYIFFYFCFCLLLR